MLSAKLHVFTATSNNISTSYH